MTIVSIFGGTGFLGRRLVQAFAAAGAEVRVAVRHPERAAERLPGGPAVEALKADVLAPRTLPPAVEGAEVVVNAVSLYVERGRVTYRAVHVEGAGSLAEACRKAGTKRLLQVSGIGSDPHAKSRYIACRGAGEEAVLEAFPEATILRPSVMFGPDDRFLNAFVALARRSPVLPLIGGETRLQPVDVEDVAEAARRLSERPESRGERIELGGPEQLQVREILERISRRLERRPLLVPLPFALAEGLARLTELLPAPPLSLAQVELLEKDNLAEGPGLEALGIVPRGIDETLNRILAEKG